MAAYTGAGLRGGVRIALKAIVAGDARLTRRSRPATRPATCMAHTGGKCGKPAGRRTALARRRRWGAERCSSAREREETRITMCHVVPRAASPVRPRTRRPPLDGAGEMGTERAEVVGSEGGSRHGTAASDLRGHAVPAAPA